MDKLDEREQDIIQSHYFQGETFESISQRLGVSKQRVSQLHLRAVRKMRESLGETDVTYDALKEFSMGKSPPGTFGYPGSG